MPTGSVDCLNARVGWLAAAADVGLPGSSGSKAELIDHSTEVASILVNRVAGMAAAAPA